MIITILGFLCGKSLFCFYIQDYVMATLDKYQIALVDSSETKLIIPANATTAENPLDCKATPPLAFVTPAGWLAATLTFKVLPYLLNGVIYPTGAPLNTDLATVYDETETATAYSMSTAAGLGYYRLPPVLFNGVRYINIISGVAQTNGAIINMVLTPLWQGIHA